MKLLKRFLIGFLYAIPFLAIHIGIGYLGIKDPGTIAIIKKVSYGALGVYTALIIAVAAIVVAATGLMSLRYLFGYRISLEKTKD